MTTVAGFELVDLIGQGGFGTVHRARDVAHGRDVAVKVLPMALDESARRRFDRERRAMGRVSGHPGIGIVHTSGTTADHEPYIVMELLTGGSLADRITRRPLTERETLTVGLAMADALGAAHAEGVLHLDVKPENILFSEFGTPKLVDFGIAALADDDEGTATVRATPAFAAPEVLDGDEPTALADVYGLAATMFAAVSGRAPYGGSSALAVLRSIAVEPVPVLEPGLASPGLADLLRRSMSRDLAQRPASMQAFAAELQTVAAAPTSNITPPPAPAPPPATAPGTASATAAAPAAGLGAYRSGDVRPGQVAPVPVAGPRRDGQRAGIALVAVSALIVVIAIVVSQSFGGDTTTADDPATSVAGGLDGAGSAGADTPTSLVTPTTEADAAPSSAVAAATVSVPDLVGATAERAVITTRNLGLLVQIPAHCEDRIVSQTPVAGSPTDPGSTVTVEFAPCEVPQFVGLRLPAAVDLAEATPGLGIGWPDHCDDLVTAQQPAAGTIVAPNTRIELELVPC